VSEGGFHPTREPSRDAFQISAGIEAVIGAPIHAVEKSAQRDTWFVLLMTGRAVGNGICDEKSRCFVNSQECTSFDPFGR
jgi:hypothetical protein